MTIRIGFSYHIPGNKQGLNHNDLNRISQIAEGLSIGAEYLKDVYPNVSIEIPQPRPNFDVYFIGQNIKEVQNAIKEFIKRSERPSSVICGYKMAEEMFKEFGLRPKREVPYKRRTEIPLEMIVSQ